MTVVQSHTTYRTKPVTSLTEAEFDECCRYNLATEGGHPYASMRPTLQALRTRPDAEGWATILRDRGTFVGWTLTFRADGYGRTPVGSLTTHFYVRPEYRNHGYGRTLYRIVERKFGKVEVVPWDDRSRGFFTAIGAIG